MGRRTAAVEQARLGEQKRARTHARHAAHLGGRARQDAEQARIAIGHAHPVAADHDERVDAGDRPQPLGFQRKPGRGAHRTRLRGRKPQPVRARRLPSGDLEGRDRSGGVEQLKIREQHEEDCARHRRPPNIAD
jgi:hypothetical protein